MQRYLAEIVNLSLSDPKMIENYPVLAVKKRFLGYVKIYTVSIGEQELEDAVSAFQKNMSTALKKEWYITFHTRERVIVVFRQRIFRLSGKGIAPVYQKRLDTSRAEEKEAWDEMLAYAKSLGIPDDQCDFLPEGFDRQTD